MDGCDGEMFLCPALNTFAPFVSALKELVLRGPRPMSEKNAKMVPLIRSGSHDKDERRDTASLLMVGVSLANRLGSGLGPGMNYCSEQRFQSIKTSSCQVGPLLRELCGDNGLQEAFIWNTCSRFELYVWPEQGADEVARSALIARLRRKIFVHADGRVSAEGKSLPVNVLVGADAWHHLMRTAVGLNSGLHGDRDVLDQLQTAQRVAPGADTALAAVRCL